MNQRILVVEDNTANLDLMLYLLRAFGYEAEGVQHPKAGLEKALHDRYDGVVCDIQMPDIDGFEFARRYREGAGVSGAPLIAVTALAMLGDRERILASGFDGYIPKPIEPETFVSTVAEIMRKRRAEHHLGAATGPTVLVVDDVAVNAEVIRGVLAPSGYRVLAAPDVRAARALVAEEKPALVLCDVHMPGGDGYELLAAMKADATTSETPFLFISSTAWHTRERERGMALGATGFVLRPIDPQQLLILVRNALGETAGSDSGR